MRASRRFLNRPIQTHQTDAAEPFFAPAQQTGVQAESEDTFFSPAPQSSKGECASGTIQTKLSVNAPGDKHEQEADMMADKVVQRMSAPEEKEKVHKKGKPEEEEIVQRMSAPEEEKDKIHKKGKPEEEEKVQRMSAPEEEKDKVHKKGKPEEEEKVQRMSAPEEEKDKVHKKGKPEDEEPLQRKCAECEKEEGGQVQRQSDGSSTAPSGVTQQIESSKGQGSKLSDDTRTQMESSFGTDFSHVTIHTDHESTEMNNALHAQAFTHGSDIYFNEGKYNPHNTEGGRLLAHELTHVVQQGGAQVKSEPQEMIPGFGKNHNYNVQTKLINTIQCDKIDYRQLAWSDFKAPIPKGTTYEAETASGYKDPDLNDYPFKKLVATEIGTSIGTDKEKVDCAKGMGKDSKAAEHPEKYKAFSVNLEPDMAKLKTQIYMDQDKSWVKAYHYDMKQRELKASAEYVPKCIKYFTENEKSCTDDATKSCKEETLKCEEAFKGKISSYELEGAKATNKAECKSILEPACIKSLKDYCIKSLEYSISSQNGVKAKASKKLDCDISFKNDVVNKVMEDQSRSLLNHEQRHLDITNQIATQATDSIVKLVNSFDKEVKTCSKDVALDNAQKLITDYKDKISKELTTYRERLSSIQNTYDSESNHGTIPAGQAWWGSNIDKHLPEQSGAGKF